MPMINAFDVRAAYNPDVLTCLANLSSDEVFTPPQLANQMLDLLPIELWRDPNARFLDPACKSGVFLREIARRLDLGWNRRCLLASSGSTISYTINSSASRSLILPRCCRAAVCTARRPPTASTQCAKHSRTNRAISALSVPIIHGTITAACSAARVKRLTTEAANWKATPMHSSTITTLKEFLI